MHGHFNVPLPKLLLEYFHPFLETRSTQGTFSMHFLAQKLVLSLPNFHSSTQQK
jgi:hypothetical protein